MTTKLLCARRGLVGLALFAMAHATAPAMAAEAAPAALVATSITAQPAVAAAGLQLQLLAGQPVKSAEAFMANKGERRLHLVVQRDVESERIGVALARALAGTPVSTQLSAMAQLGAAFAGRRSFVRGDTIIFELRPGQEMRLLINKTAFGYVDGGERLLETMVRAWATPTGT